MTQAGTMKKAQESLREAVELWFESCIERNALDEALKELGFSELALGETPADGAETVAVVREADAQPVSRSTAMSFSIDADRADTVSANSEQPPSLFFFRAVEIPQAACSAASAPPTR